jgi:tetratricopeptide (TPR) repeat protein
MKLTRVQIVGVIVGIVVVALAVYAAAFFTSNEGRYQGLVLQDDTGLTPESQAYFEQQLNTAESAIAAAEASGEEVDWSLYLTAAWNAAALGDLVKARETYEDYLDLNQINPAPWNAYGSVLMRMEDYPAAEDAFKTAAELAPSEEFFRDWIMAIENQAPNGERDEEVKNILEVSVDTIGQNPWSMTELAQWYLRHDECDKALDHYEVAKDLLPPDNEAIVQDIAAARAQCSE